MPFDLAVDKPGVNVCCLYYGPVRLQRFSQRMPTYEKLMQNVGIRNKVERKKSEEALS